MPSLCATCLLVVHSLQAQISLDGSLGPSGPLAPTVGPGGIARFGIGPDLGCTKGPNLFHSFDQFNVAFGQEAAFSGPGSIQNILARVTGGPSTIDGKLISEVPGANLFLLNPKGILFDAHASLEVDGSFHASTADYIALSDGNRFEAAPTDCSLLTAAPPAAFGFLGPPPGGIRVSQASLRVPDSGPTKQNQLSLVGGDVSIEGKEDGERARVEAAGGTVVLASMTSAGELAIAPEKIPDTASAFSQQGHIMMAAGAVVDATPIEGGAGGQVMIRGGKLTLIDAGIRKDSYQAGAGWGVDIQTTGDIEMHAEAIVRSEAQHAEGKASGVRMKADRVFMEPGSQIRANNTSSGDGPDVDLAASEVVRIKEAQIRTDTYGEGAAGDILVTAPLISLQGEPLRLSASAGGGPHGGTVTLHTADLWLAGRAATLEADEVNIKDAAIVQAYGVRNGGDILITAKCITIYADQCMAQGGGDCGRAPPVPNDAPTGEGYVRILANRLAISDAKVASLTGGYIYVASSEKGTPADVVSITTSPQGMRPRCVKGLSTSTSWGYDAGPITIIASQLNMDGAVNVVQSGGVSDKAGGSIALFVERLCLESGSEVSVATGGPGSAGQLFVLGSQAGQTWGLMDSLRWTDWVDAVEHGFSTAVLKILSDAPAGNVHVSGSNSGTSRASGILIGTGLVAASVYNPRVSEVSGSAGTIVVSARSIELTGPNAVVASFAQTQAGNAGTVILASKENLTITDGAKVRVESDYTEGGDVYLSGGSQVYLHNAFVLAKSKSGKGGNIAIPRLLPEQWPANLSPPPDWTPGVTPEFVILNHSVLDASSDSGVGGNVGVVAHNYVKSADTAINVTGKLAEGKSELSGATLSVTPDVGPVQAAQLQEPATWENPEAWQRVSLGGYEEVGLERRRGEVQGRKRLILEAEPTP